MSRFISSEKVPVYLEDDPANIIYIKPKMDLGTLSAVRSELAKLVTAQGAASVEVDFGSKDLIILKHNIVAWTGPDFIAHPFNLEALQKFDPDDPLLQKVIEEIDARNPQKQAEGVDPNLSNGGSAPSKEGSKKK